MTLPARLWALATAGLLTRLNHDDHTLLGGAAPSAEAARISAEVLTRDWEAPDRAALLQTLDWLAREGDRRELNKVVLLDAMATSKLQPGEAIGGVIDDQDALAKIHFAHRHGSRLGARSLIAWDAARLVAVAGWGYLARMISEEEAWSYILPAAEAVQRVYASWDELGKHYMLGHEFWKGAWDSELARCHLAMFDDPASPWRVLPWSTDLSQHGISAPLKPFVVEGALVPHRATIPEPLAHAQGGVDVSRPVPAPGASGGGSGKTIAIVVAVIVALALVGTVAAFALGLFGGGGSTAPGAAAPAGAPPRSNTQPAPKPAPAQPVKKR
jgi:hypothetical protein